MRQWIKIESIPGVLATAYEKGTRLVSDSYYSQVAEEIVAHLPGNTLLDIGTGPGYLPIEIAVDSFWISTAAVLTFFHRVEGLPPVSNKIAV